VLKIDKSFIDGLGTDSQDTAIVGATIALAEALGMYTIAEGVEQQAQLDQLQRMGCEQYQGYLFSRPGSAFEINALLRQRTSARGAAEPLHL
jgi:EAL domain-containing protein (putative c-di-GMP-specific phosphodiesterase class I)